MARKHDLQDWVVEVLKAKGGRARIVEICKYIWDNYEDELRNSGDLFYTWQYDVRWAGTRLRKAGIMRGKESSPKGIWELV